MWRSTSTGSNRQWKILSPNMLLTAKWKKTTKKWKRWKMLVRLTDSKIMKSSSNRRRRRQTSATARRRFFDTVAYNCVTDWVWYIRGMIMITCPSWSASSASSPRVSPVWISFLGLPSPAGTNCGSCWCSYPSMILAYFSRCRSFWWWSSIAPSSHKSAH